MLVTTDIAELICYAVAKGYSLDFKVEDGSKSIMVTVRYEHMESIYEVVCPEEVIESISNLDDLEDFMDKFYITLKSILDYEMEISEENAQ